MPIYVFPLSPFSSTQDDYTVLRAIFLHFAFRYVTFITLKDLSGTVWLTKFRILFVIFLDVPHLGFAFTKTHAPKVLIIAQGYAISS